MPVQYASLTNKTPAETYTQLLHCGEAAPGPGMQVMLGDGTATGWRMYPETAGVLAQSVATTPGTTVPATLAALASTPAKDGVYLMSAVLLLQTNDATVGPVIQIQGPEMAVFLTRAAILAANGSTAHAATLAALAADTPATLISAATLPAADTPYLCEITGTLTVGADAGDLSLTITASDDTAASAVSVLAGSSLRLRRLA